MISFISYQLYRFGFINVPIITEDEYNWKQRSIIHKFNKKKKRMKKRKVSQS